MATWWVNCYQCKAIRKIQLEDNADPIDARHAFADLGWQVGGNGRHWMCPEHAQLPDIQAEEDATEE